LAFGCSNEMATAEKTRSAREIKILLNCLESSKSARLARGNRYNRCLATKVCSRSNELLKSVHFHAVNVITGTCLASRLHESPKRLCANEDTEVGAPMKRSSRQSNQAQTCMLIESYTCNYACVCTNQIWGGIDISRIVCV
jgi:hypothetical protein